jgi:thioredoxin
MITNVRSDTFEAEILKADLPVVVDLWAPWCGPCRAAAPVLESLATEYAGRVKVVKVNVDDEPEIAGAFQVQGIPTFAVVHSGALVGAVSGFGGRPHLKQLFDAAEAASAAPQGAK